MFLTPLLAASILAAIANPQEAAAPSQQAVAAEQELVNDWSAAVLYQGGTIYTAEDVLRVAFAADDPLIAAYRDPNTAELFRIYLNSPRFYEIVREFSDWLAVFGKEESDSKPVGQTMTEQLANRLDANQPTDFTMPELRQHYIKSVPEFHGQMQCSWIRLPLVDMQTGEVLSQDARNGLHKLLTGVGERIKSKALAWDDAVLTYSEDPISRKRKGAAGILRRQSTKQFEESMLKQLFADLGYKRIDDRFLHGPIFGKQWVYLIRVEAVRIFGTGDLVQVRDEIEASLRESMHNAALAVFTKGVERKILLPIRNQDS